MHGFNAAPWRFPNLWYHHLILNLDPFDWWRLFLGVFGISFCVAGHGLVAQLLIELRALHPFFLQQQRLIILQICLYLVLWFSENFPSFSLWRENYKTVSVTGIWTTACICIWLQSFIMLVVWCCSVVLTYVSIYISLSFVHSLLASSRSGQKATSRGRRKRRRRGRARLSRRFTATHKTAP